MSDEVEGQLFEMMQRKAVTEIGQLLDSLDIDDDVRTMLAGLSTLNGDESVFAKARELLKTADKDVLDAIDYLEETATLTRKQYGDIKIHFDLSELHGYHYKTGVVFAAFVPQLGQAIARGGRYDDIGEVFGRARAATGFSTDMKILGRLSDKQYEMPSKILAPADDDDALQEKVSALRAEGNVVIRQLAGQQVDAQSMGCDMTLNLVDGEWILNKV